VERVGDARYHSRDPRAEAMNVSGQDINQTLEYRWTTAIVRLLPTGLLLIFLGLCIFALVDLDREPWTIIGIVLCWMMGAALVGLTLWRRSNPGKPLFTLSSDGIQYRIPLVKQVLIPWHEIQGVDTVDIEAGYWSFLWFTRFPTPRYNTWVARDVTVILLPRSFYDRRIFVDSPFLRGPGWNANFIPKGSLIQMALHHELVSVEPRELREAVEARWLAFRDRPAGEPARTSVPSVSAASHSNASKGAAARPAPTSGVVAMGDDSKAMSPWEATKVIVPLIGIAVVLANLIGLWDLPGQDKVREVRTKARAEQKDWADSIRRNREESLKLEAEQKELRRQLDEDIRRMFSR
jgi:hypothetical protein